MTITPDIRYPFLVTQARKNDGSVEWEAEVLDLPGCVAAAETLEELIEMVAAAIEDWIDTAQERGMDIPESSTPDRFSGKLTLRIPPTLHRRLALQAKRSQVSLNSYLNTLLAFGLGRNSTEIQFRMSVSFPQEESWITDSAAYLSRRPFAPQSAIFTHSSEEFTREVGKR